jgi:hypothetical protein
VSVQSRLRQVARAVQCPECGLSLVHIRDSLRATVEIIRRELPSERAEAVVDELRRIWSP